MDRFEYDTPVPVSRPNVSRREVLERGNEGLMHVQTHGLTLIKYGKR